MTRTSIDRRTTLIRTLTAFFLLACLPSSDAAAAPPPRGNATPQSVPPQTQGFQLPLQAQENTPARDSLEPGPRRRPHRHGPNLYDPAPGQQRINPTGRITKLIIMVRFRNHRHRKLPTREQYDVIFNRKNGHPELAPEGSASDYSRQISYGQMEINSHIVDWIDLPNDEDYYANGVQGTGEGNRMAEAIEYALDYVDEHGLVDFGSFDRAGNNDGYADLVGFVHSGYGAEWGGQDADGVYSNDRIWSHQWRLPKLWTSKRSGVHVAKYAFSSGLYRTFGSQPCRIGLLAHEAAHLGELPDLYGGEGTGIGAWGLMGYSDGFLDTGHRPTHMSAWSKFKLGWVTPRELKASGVYQIEQAETQPENSPLVYIIKEGFPDDEYLLIENRQPVGFDREIPNAKGGLAIWHIDENKWNRPGQPYDPAKTENREPGFPGQPGWPANNKHYMVALVQADGRFDLEQGLNYGDDSDLFRGGGVDAIDSRQLNGLRPYLEVQDRPRVYHRISRISEPGKVMSFHYEIRRNEDAPPPPIAAERKPPVTKSTGDTGTEVRPIAGAKVASASFTHLDHVQHSGDGILLTATITLNDECTVFVRGNTSLKSGSENGIVATGFNNSRESETAMWKESVRFITTRPDRGYASVDVSARRRLPAGTHTIRWVVRSTGTLHFPGGGVLSVQAYPCPPSNAASEAKKLASRLDQ